MAPVIRVRRPAPCGSVQAFDTLRAAGVKPECARLEVDGQAARCGLRDRRGERSGERAAPAAARGSAPIGRVSASWRCISRALLASAAAVLAARGTPWLLPAMLLHGILLVFLFAPLHEAVHRTAFRSRWLNDGVARACGAVLILPPDYFRAFHFTHHRHTQDPARDPELSTPKPASPGGLSLARQRPALLARAHRDHPAPRARAGQRSRSSRRTPSPASCARRGCCSASTRLLALALAARRQRPSAAGSGSCRRCSASRSCASICWPSTRSARWCRRCCATRAPPAAPRWSAGWPGTCPITPSTTPTLPCRSTRCRRRTAARGEDRGAGATAMSRCSGRSSARSAPERCELSARPRARR